MGEIDCRVFFETKIEYYKSISSSKDRTEIIESVVNKYFNLLYDVYGKNHKLIFWGPVASYPNKQSSEYLGFHPDSQFFQPGSYTNKERNELTKIFNERLKQLCDEKDVLFLTMFYDMLDENYNTKAEMTDGIIHLHVDTKPLVMEKFKSINLIS